MSPPGSDTVKSFIRKTRELRQLQSILENLMWDQETMMPRGGGPLRAGQVSTLAAICHRKITDPELGELLERLQDGDHDLWLSAAVRETRREYDKATRLPEELIRELSETCTLAYENWIQARQASDFLSFGPWLRKIIELKRQQALCLHTSGNLYDALLDDFEPDTTAHQLDQVFAQVQPRLSHLLGRIQASEKQPARDLLKGHYPRQEQKAFGERMLTAMGFRWEIGRLDESPHPFCTGISPLDVRITTRYSEEDFASSFFGVVHEGGHALYEQGLGEEHYGSPACDGISMGIHESQSRLWENMVARSPAFWEHWLPHLREAFPGQLEHISLEEFVHAINRVETSPIRVEADEVTYGLHIILRYELERLLIDDALKVQDLEEAWNEKMRNYLGITPESSAQGVLQDIHWSHGSFGYFPTYLLGNLYAAQIFEQARASLPELEEHIRTGKLMPLREWLREQIHQRGKTVTADALIREVSGQSLQPEPFLHYLESKFEALYGLQD